MKQLAILIILSILLLLSIIGYIFYRLMKRNAELFNEVRKEKMLNEILTADLESLRNQLANGSKKSKS